MVGLGILMMRGDTISERLGRDSENALNVTQNLITLSSLEATRGLIIPTGMSDDERFEKFKDLLRK